VEDQKFLSGAGRFIEDLSFPGELHCAIVRSPHAHARILGIRAPEGVQLLAGEDMARDGVQPMRCGWVLPGMVEPTRHALARGIVRHVGEPVAVVLAESKSLAEDAAEQVEVDY
jgi:carbon-monoxide dehydrogenase large subunit